MTAAATGNAMKRKSATVAAVSSGSSNSSARNSTATTSHSRYTRSSAEINAKKILEDLQAKKQQLHQKPITLGNTPPTGIQQGASTVENSAVARALRTANEQSFGFFVPQNSAFGNLFLPVLPRFDGAASTK